MTLVFSPHIISKARVLRIVYQLPANDSVVVAAIFDNYVLKPAGDDSIVETLGREKTETIRISGQVDAVRAVFGSVVVGEQIIIRPVNHQITRVQVGGGVIAFGAPSGGAELGRSRLAARQRKIHLSDFAENYANSVSVGLVVEQRTLLIAGPDSKERIGDVIIFKAHVVAIDHDDAVNRGQRSAPPGRGGSDGILHDIGAITLLYKDGKLEIAHGVAADERVRRVFGESSMRMAVPPTVSFGRISNPQTTTGEAPKT